MASEKLDERGGGDQPRAARHHAALPADARRRSPRRRTRRSSSRCRSTCWAAEGRGGLEGVIDPRARRGRPALRARGTASRLCSDRRGLQMFNAVQVIGAGRAGAAIAGRLRERGLLAPAGPDTAAASATSLVLLCVPDDQDCAASRPASPRARGSRTSAARRPLRRSPRTAAVRRPSAADASRARAGPSSSTAPGAPSRRRPPRRARARSWLAETLGLRPFELADEDRALYHAGAAFASNYLVTLYRAAVVALRGGRRAARGARAADDAHDRERLRAHRAHRARRLAARSTRTAPRSARTPRARCRSTTRSAEATRAR